MGCREKSQGEATGRSVSGRVAARGGGDGGGAVVVEVECVRCAAEDLAGGECVAADVGALGSVDCTGSVLADECEALRGDRQAVVRVLGGSGGAAGAGAAVRQGAWADDAVAFLGGLSGLPRNGKDIP